jgi:GLPGLI family protein
MNKLHIKLICTLLLFISIETFLTAQSITAIYGKSLDKPLLIGEKKPEFDKFLGNMEQTIKLELKDLEFKLVGTKSESTFEVIERLAQISETRQGSAIGLEEGEGITYTNLSTKQKIAEFEAFDQLYKIISSSEINWELKNDIKTIGNYQCNRAIGVKLKRKKEGYVGQIVTAWYTTDIPFSHGPAGYGGLPGLIIELSVGRISFFLKKLEINPKGNPKIPIPNKGKKITQEELYQIGQSITPETFENLRK